MAHSVLRIFNHIVKWPFFLFLKFVTMCNNNKWYTEFNEMPIILSGLPSKKFLLKNKNRISLIVNMCDEFMYDSFGIPMVRYNVLDGIEPTVENYEDASITIEKEIDKIKGTDKKILIHCKSGQYRSASILIAWMFYHGIKYNNNTDITECFNFVKMRRPQIGNNIILRKNIVSYISIIKYLYY